MPLCDFGWFAAADRQRPDLIVRVCAAVIRLASNFTARRNTLAAHKRGRKPTYGALLRPLPRQYKRKLTPATPADQRATWGVNGRTIRVEIWRELVLPTCAAHPDNQTFDVYAFHDPAFKHPWLLATPVKLHFESVHAL